MARTNRDGNTLRRVLEYTLRQDLTDAELASVLGMSAAKYSRHKDDDNFPSFEQLGILADYYGINATLLRYDFRYLDGSEADQLAGHIGDKTAHIMGTATAAAPTKMIRRLRARTDIPPV